MILQLKMDLLELELRKVLSLLYIVHSSINSITKHYLSFTDKQQLITRKFSEELLVTLFLLVQVHTKLLNTGVRELKLETQWEQVSKQNYLKLLPRSPASCSLRLIYLTLTKMPSYKLKSLTNKNWLLFNQERSNKLNKWLVTLLKLLKLELRSSMFKPKLKPIALPKLDSVISPSRTSTTPSSV